MHGQRDCVFSIRIFFLSDQHNDIASKYPKIVQQMSARIDELAKSEVTLEASGLCPTASGSHPDPLCNEKAKETGFWMPWCRRNSTAVGGWHCGS